MISRAISNILSGNKLIKILIYLILACIETFIELIDYLVPKDDRIIIFGSNGGEYSSGSPRALYEYIRSNDSNYVILYYLPFKKEAGLFNKIKYCFIFAPVFFKAKFLVSSHPPSDFFPFLSWSTKKFFINTWHGIPLKGMFFMDRSVSRMELIRILKLNKRTSVFIVSSSLEGFLMTLCFRINPVKIFPSGHPRNDILLKKNRACRLPILLPNLPTYRKVILYCPTYRRGKGVKFFPFPDFDIQEFEKFLEDNKIIILLRSHPYDKAVTVFSSKRIILFDYNICNDVNEILPEVDILVTDYSSIYFDYLLLNRPCIFVPYDLEEYKKTVGLLLDYDVFAAGPKVLTYKRFVESIKEILEGIDPYSNKRSRLKTIFHEYQKENSCERILMLMNSLRKKCA